jgi:ketosteroid isomerase-like protein
MPRNSNTTQIRGLIATWARAVRAKDMDGVLANHTDDIVMFDGKRSGVPQNVGVLTGR